MEMVPQVTTKVDGRSKRALLPFVGNIASNFFGVATEGDVIKLAPNLNIDALVFHKHDSNNLAKSIFKCF
jgi:hypothetical protein